MEASELRIGNWVYYEQESGSIMEMKVNQITRKYAPNSGEIYLINDRFLADFEPIPLTEEWLIKFGFEKIDTGHLLAWSIGDFHLLTTLGELNILITFNNSSVDIKTVHHLQNLYFALTGEELTIKQ